MNGTLKITLTRAYFVHDTDSYGKMDLYAILILGLRQNKSSVAKNAGRTPFWNQDFVIPYGGETDLGIKFYYENSGSDNHLGDALVPLKPVLGVPVQDKNLSIVDNLGRHCGMVDIRLEFNLNGVPPTPDPTLRQFVPPPNAPISVPHPGFNPLDGNPSPLPNPGFGFPPGIPSPFPGQLDFPPHGGPIPAPVPSQTNPNKNDYAPKEPTFPPNPNNDLINHPVSDNQQQYNYGYHPQPGNAYPPQPGNAYPSQPGNAYTPQPSNAYPPQLSNAYPPQPDNAYPPQPGTAYPPQPNFGYPPQPNYGYPLQPNYGYPQSNYGYSPQPNYGYPPQTNYGYPPQPNYGYPSQNQFDIHAPVPGIDKMPGLPPGQPGFAPQKQENPQPKQGNSQPKQPGEWGY